MTPPWFTPRTLRVLARPRRLEVLRLLRQRPHTPTELARVLEASPSTIRDDLEVLVGAGLVARRDDPRVWAYHELTDDGRRFTVAGPLTPGAAALALAAASIACLAAWNERRPDPIPFGSLPSPVPPDPLQPWLLAAGILLGLLGLLLGLAATLLARARAATSS